MQRRNFIREFKTESVRLVKERGVLVTTRCPCLRSGSFLTLRAASGLSRPVDELWLKRIKWSTLIDQVS
jgi:hypothetical protein